MFSHCLFEMGDTEGATNICKTMLTYACDICAESAAKLCLAHIYQQQGMLGER